MLEEELPSKKEILADMIEQEREKPNRFEREYEDLLANYPECNNKPSVWPWIFIDLILAAISMMATLSLMYKRTDNPSFGVACCVYGAWYVSIFFAPMLPALWGRFQFRRKCLKQLEDPYFAVDKATSLLRKRLSEEEAREVGVIQGEIVKWDDAKRRLAAHQANLAEPVVEEMAPAEDLKIRIALQVKDCERAWDRATERLAAKCEYYRRRHEKLEQFLAHLKAGMYVKKIEEDLGKIDEKILLEEARADVDALTE